MGSWVVRGLGSSSNNNHPNHHQILPPHPQTKPQPQCNPPHLPNHPDPKLIQTPLLTHNQPPFKICFQSKFVFQILRRLIPHKLFQSRPLLRLSNVKCPTDGYFFISYINLAVFLFGGASFTEAVVGVAGGVVGVLEGGSGFGGLAEEVVEAFVFGGGF